MDILYACYEIQVQMITYEMIYFHLFRINLSCYLFLYLNVCHLILRGLLYLNKLVDCKDELVSRLTLSVG